MNNKRMPKWVAVAVTFAVATSAASAILFLRRWADQATESTLILTRLHQKVAHLDAIEYRGLAAGRLKPKYVQEAQELQARMRTLLTEMPDRNLLTSYGRAPLRRISPVPTNTPSSEYHDLRECFEYYDQAITEVFGLMAEGKLEQARRADEQRLDPVHEHLEELLNQQKKIAGDIAEQKNLQADIGTIAAILISAIIIAWTMQKVNEANRLAEVALAEQSLLKSSEVALRKERELLEARVAERTQEVEYQNFTLSQTLSQLQAAQNDLIESEKMVALGHLVAGIAHEINTPLGAIQASSGNMTKALDETLGELPQIARRLTPEQQADFLVLLGRVLNSKPPVTSNEKRPLRRALTAELEAQGVEHARHLADRLVDVGIFGETAPHLALLQSAEGDWVLQLIYNLSRIQGNTRTINTAVERAAKIVFALKSYARFDQSGSKQPLNVTEGIETVLELYRSKLKHGISVIRDYGTIPELLGYPDELLQVWTNLIHNAIQAMDSQGKLAISAVVEDHLVVVKITDSGKGIDAETQARIFEPFFTTKPQGEGSGLGLSISKTIVEKHEGQIEVISRPGQTTFSVRIPFKPACVDALTEAHPNAPLSQPVPDAFVAGTTVSGSEPHSLATILT
jgi:signal transduction histidine kinase